MITEEKLQRAEHWLHRYEAGGIFFARLLPVIRHLISIPAGIIRMNFGIFSAMTVAGSAIWCTILAIYGRAGPRHLRRPASRLGAGSRGRPRLHPSQSHPLVAGVLILCVLYFVFLKLTAAGAHRAHRSPRST